MSEKAAPATERHERHGTPGTSGAGGRTAAGRVLRQRSRASGGYFDQSVRGSIQPPADRRREPGTGRSDLQPLPRVEEAADGEGAVRRVPVQGSDPAELALLSTWFREATVGELTEAHAQRAYTDRELVRAMHAIGFSRTEEPWAAHRIRLINSRAVR